MAMRIPLLIRSLTAAAVIIGALGLAGGAHAATVYKWTDEQGVTHYTDTPPPGKGDEVQRLELDITGSRPSPQEKQPEEDKDKAPAPEDVNVTQAEIEVQKLEEQVQKARQVYEQARENRIEGEKVRKGNEQNYVRYLERIENLRNQEEAAQERLETLRSQLEKARSRLEELKQKKQKAQQEGS